MSHAATKWAFDQPEIHSDMKPSEWAVLVVLADCHNPVNGCFPSQDYICRRTNLGERAVRDQLTRLRERGLIDWDCARENGRRGSNRYRLSFEPDFQPAKSAGSSTGEIVQEQPADSDSFNRQNLPPNPVREPVREPLSAQAREKEPDVGIEDRKATERAFERAFRAWPTSIGDSRPDALKAWTGLSADERLLAGSEAERYVAAAKATGRSHICSHAVYLRERRWEGLAPREPDTPQLVEAKPFGKAWMAERLSRLLAGPTRPTPALTGFELALIRDGKADAETRLREKQANSGFPNVALIDERAASARGITVPASMEAAASAFEPVRVGGERWEEWKLDHALRGWPWLPDTGRQEWVYFPAGGPDGLQAFEDAMRNSVTAEAAE